MAKRFIVFAAALLLWGTAEAAAPRISGTYVMVLRTYCTPTLVPSFQNSSTIGQYVQDLNIGTPHASNPNEMRFEIVKAIFNDATLSVTFTSQKVDASATMVQSSGNLEGNGPFQGSQQGADTYSNAVSTFTLGSSTYNAIYGAVSRTGVAKFLAFIGLDADQAGCMTEGEMTLK